VAGVCHGDDPDSTGQDEEDGRAGSTGSGVIVVLDTGGVDGLAPMDEARRARLRALRERAHDIVVPAAVLAEGVFNGRPGHDYHVRRLLDTVDVADVDEALGHAAGALRTTAMRGGHEPAPSESTPSSPRLLMPTPRTMTC
jgi:hypothetical protein